MVLKRVTENTEPRVAVKTNDFKYGSILKTYTN